MNIAPTIALTTAAAANDRPTLLFVDDEQRILRSLKLLFARDYHVLATTSGKDALAILRQQKVHVLICDQRMPHMAGVEVLREARLLSPNTMRLLLTGYADVEAVIGSINEGEIFRYLTKPWQQEEIRTIVASAASIALALDQAPGCKTLAVAERGAVSVSILLIDGASEVAEALQSILDQHLTGRYRLEWARSLEEAMAVLETQEIGLVISELKVGSEDAMPFLKTLKRFHPHIVTIILSSFQDISMLVEMVNQGQIHRFLPKPVRANMTARSVLSGVQLHHNIRRQPRLAERHRVEAPVREQEGGLFGRLRHLVRRVGLS
jgi:DNA-binding NtrC family response regulator